MKMLVTGGAGFIGSHVQDALIHGGHEVTVLDDLSSGKRRNLHPSAKFYELPIGAPEVEEVFHKGNFDMVFHLAAQIDVRKSVSNPVFDAQVNILDGIRLLEYCRNYQVKKIIYSSTGGAIYGEGRTIPAPESHVVRPMAPYGISKFGLEKYIEYFGDMYNLDYTILRYANVYGPRQDPHGEAGVVAIFINLLLDGKPCKVFGDGEQTRDYVYVEDIVRANLLALDTDAREAMNLGTGKETTVNELYRMIAGEMMVDAEPLYESARPGEVNRIALDYSRAEKVLGWKPEVSLGDGVARTVEFFRKLTLMTR